MTPSAEVRWLVPGPVPEAVAAWFHALGAPVEPTTRTDRYLVPLHDGLGLKLRGGGLQIEPKQRAAVLGPVRPRPGVAGQAERWQKWSFPLAESPPAPEGPWVEVLKTRWLRTYRDEAGRLVPTDEPESGLVHGLELTAVEVLGEPWWTVGVETSGGSPDALADALFRALPDLLGPAPPALALEQSRAYPAWLRAVTAGRSRG